jgi:hypothetical protein
MQLQQGYVVYWRGPACGEEVDWRCAGQALPEGAVPAIVCDGVDTLTLHGHGHAGLGAALDAAQAEAESDLAL